MVPARTLVGNILASEEGGQRGHRGAKARGQPRDRRPGPPSQASRGPCDPSVGAACQQDEGPGDSFVNVSTRGAYTGP